MCAKVEGNPIISTGVDVFVVRLKYKKQVVSIFGKASWKIGLPSKKVNIGTTDGFVRRGYFSFPSLYDAFTYKNQMLKRRVGQWPIREEMGYAIFKATIPKGTKYVRGTIHKRCYGGGMNVYVSEKLMHVEEVQ